MTKAQSVAVWKERSAGAAQSRGADEWVAIGAPSISLKTQFKKKSICGGTKKEWFRAEGQLRPGWTAEWRNDRVWKPEWKKQSLLGLKESLIGSKKKKRTKKICHTETFNFDKRGYLQKNGWKKGLNCSHTGVNNWIEGFSISNKGCINNISDSVVFYTNTDSTYDYAHWDSSCWIPQIYSEILPIHIVSPPADSIFDRRVEET